MGSQRLDQLAEAGPLDGSEQLYVLQNGNDRRIPSDTYELTRVYDITRYASPQAAIDQAETDGGGVVWHPRNHTVDIDAPLDVSAANVIYEGAGRSSQLRATTAMTHMVRYQSSGSRPNDSGMRRMSLNANGLAVNAFLVDSWRHFVSEDVICNDLDGGVMYDMTSDQSGNCEDFDIVRSLLMGQGSEGHVKAQAGSAGTVADGYMDVFTLGLTGWNVTLDDCSRVEVNQPVAANQQAAFSGNVLITATRSGVGGEPADSRAHSILWPYTEHTTDLGNIDAVRIEAPSGLSRTIRDHTILAGTETGDLVAWLVTVNNSSTANRVRNNRLLWPRSALSAPSRKRIILGASTVHTTIMVGGDNGLIPDVVDDQASDTRINGVKASFSRGVGGAPTSSGMDVGDIMRSHADGTVWLRDEKGNNRRISDGTLRNASTATFSGDGSTTAFTIPHGIGIIPDERSVWAESADAAGDKYVSAVDGTNITVTFATAPVSGTDNVVLGFSALALA